jgi:hypothetical protein
MKKILLSLIFTALVMTACKDDFLEVPLQNSAVTEDVLANKAGVQKLLVGAYHDLSGMSFSSRWWPTAASNWIWGDITSGDCYRGGTGSPTDEPESNAIENFQTQATQDYVLNKFKAVYDGVARSNSVLRAIAKATDMSEAEKVEATGEARFLRGHFHFEAKKMWNNVPYIDETVVNFKVANTDDIWPKIVDDFKYAFDHLSEKKEFKGQANKWAAGCYLAKAYMFQGKFDLALPLLNDIIANGMNAQGVHYDLNECFADNFTGAAENGKEAVFQVQYSGNDQSYGNNSNLGELGTAPYGVDPITVWYTVWKQPSYNLVNAFKTDGGGLPLLDTFNETNMDNDNGIESWDWFVPYQGNVDPRLDWTVGRRGVPFLDYPWGYSSPNPGKDWVMNQSFGGPYLNIKGLYKYNDAYNDILRDYELGWAAPSLVNYNLIRFADVLLWAAECEVEIGDLEKARELVNRVRSRAINGCSVDIDWTTGSPSANYVAGTYDQTWASRDDARKAVRFERRLELALEGHRFFDLVRWGIAAEYINDYLAVEKTRISHLATVTFEKGKHEYFPIPQQEIDLSSNGSEPLLKQNSGY